MRSNHARHVSEASARSSQPEPDMPATAFSSTRQVVHYGLNSVHRHYRARYRTTENPDSLAAGNITNVSGEFRRPGPGRKRDLLTQALLTGRVVSYGNKQNISAVTEPGEVFGNFFPFDTGLTGQWRGRRRCGPRCGVS
jgi:hypothetical protein